MARCPARTAKGPDRAIRAQGGTARWGRRPAPGAVHFVDVRWAKTTTLLE